MGHIDGCGSRQRQTASAGELRWPCHQTSSYGYPAAHGPGGEYAGGHQELAVGDGALVLVDGCQVREDGLGDVAKHGDLLW